MGLRKRLRPRVHLGEKDENANWGPRDDVEYYGEQAKAVPEVTRGLLSMPREWVSEVRGMFADMRDERPPTR